MSRFAWVCGAVLIFAIGGIARSADPSWQPVGLSGGGAMFSPAISPTDPKCAMVHCDMSAAYLTHDGGSSWQMISTVQLHSYIHCRPAFHPTDPKIIFSPSGRSTLKISRDGGTTWETLAKFDDSLAGAIVIDPRDPTRMLVGVGKTVQLSTDSGKTWQACKDATGVFVGAHFARKGDVTRIFIATEDGVWLSDDGITWLDASAGLPFKGLRGFAGGTKDGQTTLYCTLPGKEESGQYAGGIYRWKYGGKSWELATGSGLNLDIKAFDQWTKNQIAQYYDVATTDMKPETVWCTNAQTGTPPPHHATIYRSDDSGTNWHATFFADPRYPGFNVEKDYMVTEDGQYYQHIAQIAVDPNNAEHVLDVANWACYITGDGGKTWNSGHSQAAGTPEHNVAWKCTGLVVTTTWHYYIDPHEPKRHYIGYTDIGFARSLDAGKTWIFWSKKDSSPWRNTCYELAFDPDQPGRIWGAFSNLHDIPNSNIIFNRHGKGKTPAGGICVSDDFAETWKPLEGGLPAVPATSVIVDPKSPKDARTLYASFFGVGVFKSTDGGQTWTAKNSGLGDPANMRVYRVQIHPDGTLFAVITALTKDGKFLEPGVGLYRSTNGGDSWDCITKTVPALWPKDFTLDPADSRIIYLGLCDANGQQVGGLYRTTDGGKSWALLFRQGKEHFGAYLHPTHSGWIYATICESAPTYGLYLSKDDGKTFEPIKGIPFNNPMRVTVDPADGNVIYVSTFGGSVWCGPAN